MGGECTDGFGTSLYGEGDVVELAGCPLHGGALFVPLAVSPTNFTTLATAALYMICTSK